MARPHPVRITRNPPCINHNHNHIRRSIKSIQLPRNGLDMFRTIRDIQYALCLPVHSGIEIAFGELGPSRWVQCYSVLALPVSHRLCDEN